MSSVRSSSSDGIVLEGVGLRSGRPARVVLRARPGPFALVVDGVVAARDALRAEEAERATVVRLAESGTKVATVEHLFAACAGLGLHEGLTVEVVGGEAPLLDGASTAFIQALASLALPCTPAPLVVARDAVLTHGESRYTFERAPSTRVAVTLSFDDPRIAPDAAWTGDPDDFVHRIAGARTFAFAHEVAALVAAGQASHVDPSNVVVFAPDAILSSGAPFTADEPARHKLLDLMGDLFLYGGPPRGCVHAFRPGHRATHAMVRDAMALGILTA